MNLPNFNPKDYWCYLVFDHIKRILEIRIGKHGSSDIILRKNRELSDSEINLNFRNIVDETIQEYIKELENGRLQ